jgi:serine/threonine-protein kinase
MGLARALGDEEAAEDPRAITKIGTIMGTPDFIAPEQAMDARKADIRSDLYSLGCTLYYLLTGKLPFPGGTKLDKLFRHQTEEPRSVEQLRSEVPPKVRSIVRKLMNKRPEERFQTPGELAAELAAVLRAE